MAAVGIQDSLKSTDDSPDLVEITQPDGDKGISVKFKPTTEPKNGHTSSDEVDCKQPEEEKMAPVNPNADIGTEQNPEDVENPTEETTENNEEAGDSEEQPLISGFISPDVTDSSKAPFDKQDSSGSESESELDKTALCEELRRLVRNNDKDKLFTICMTVKKQGMKLNDKEMMGKMGETTLCQAVVKGHTECAKVLIDFGGSDLIKQTYKNKQYNGASALHLAIMKQDDVTISYMLDKIDSTEKEAFLHCLANGQYFVDHFNFDCTPLSLAAGLCNIVIFDTLVQHGADLWYVNGKTGNTPLHSLGAVATYFPDSASYMLKKILQSEQVQKWWVNKKQQMDLKQSKSVEWALLKCVNKDGLTPFIYASCLGATKYAETILDVANLYTYPQWEIGPSEYKLYEVSEIDTSVTSESPEVTTNMSRLKDQTKSKLAALEIFAFLLSDDQLGYGNISAVKRTMLNKWEAYRIWFYIWLLVHLLIMILFTICVQYRQLPIVNSTNVIYHPEDLLDTQNATPAAVSDVIIDSPRTAMDVIVLIFEIIVLLYSLVFFLIELVDVVLLIQRKHWQLNSFFEKKNQTRICLTIHFDGLRALLFLFCLSVLVVLVLRSVHSPWQDLGYAVAAVSGWIFMLFFTRAFQNIGIFTIMLQRMMTRELLYFSVVFIVTMLGCGTATFALLQESSKTPPEEVSTIPAAMFSHFRLLVGLEELAIAEESRLPWMVKMIFFIFVLLGNILLLNMLIAAMNDTYSQLAKTKELFWLRMRTKAVLMMERRLPPCMKPKNKLRNFDQKNKWFIDSEEVRVWHPLARIPSS